MTTREQRNSMFIFLHFPCKTSVMRGKNLTVFETCCAALLARVRHRAGMFRYDKIIYFIIFVCEFAFVLVCFALSIF